MYATITKSGGRWNCKPDSTKLHETVESYLGFIVGLDNCIYLSYWVVNTCQLKLSLNVLSLVCHMQREKHPNTQTYTHKCGKIKQVSKPIWTKTNTTK